MKDWESCSEPSTSSEDDLQGLSDNESRENPFTKSGHATRKLQFRKNVSRARWDENINLAEVIERKGAIWTSTGIVRNKKLYLFLEETLFLAKIGALVVHHSNGMPLTTMQIAEKLAEGKNGCCFRSFMVYKRLKSLGYIVGRHNVHWTMKSCTSAQPCNINGHVSCCDVPRTMKSCTSQPESSMNSCSSLPESIMNKCTSHPESTMISSTFQPEGTMKSCVSQSESTKKSCTSQCKSTNDILSNSKIHCDDESHGDGDATSSINCIFKDLQLDDSEPTFDVYLPNCKFKKSSPGCPNYLVCLLRDSPPSRVDFERYERKSEGIPLKYCHVGGNGRVIFFSSNKIELPNLP
ncbi:hypothetical protein H6P81_004129 [Aristolochia fimbriata]|uniref:tRNA-splicing endonuclease subunit Sen54 N-terminal domain-containing protein n=1 Tax=Aristolochia fimbriata TaxID=158543 RepID=A0AAV7FFL7_ARIFI|nr:hypothetical protein H6P81_004129 [Aristolochia fimbriata]